MQKKQALDFTSRLAPMEARVADKLPEESHWQFEPKWDGFRCIAACADKRVDLYAKSGKPLGRYFPEIVQAVGAIPMDGFVLDGELVIPMGEALSFDALQARLHPAESRIKKLAAETPALLMLFDMLIAPNGVDITGKPLSERRDALEHFYEQLRNRDIFRLSPYTRDVSKARKWLSHGGALDGVIAKRLDEPYRCGERGMLKIKCLRTADCVVGGFRYGEGSSQVGSLLLGLYNESGKLDHVGFTSGFAALDRAQLTEALQKIRGGPGFTGAAPGEPSRWSTERSAAWVPLQPKLIAEVRYDHVTGHRFRHGTKFMRWRPDKAPRQCTFDQLQKDTAPAKPITEVLRH